jgi:TATA-box binding protein (TBP) (component of TFIID and TFIIIB)
MCIKGRAAAPPGIGCKTGVSTSRYPASLKKLRMCIKFGAFNKRFFYVIVYRQIYITTAVTLFRIGKCIIGFPSASVLLLEAVSRLCQNRQSIHEPRFLPLAF